MMNILIFKTVCTERFRRLLECLDTRQNCYYVVIPQKEIELYDNKRKNIFYIRTESDYIRHEVIIKENRIPMLKFDEIWVLSSSYNRYYSYNEIYAVITELRYKKFVYKVIDDKCITDFDIEKKIFPPVCYSLLICIIRYYECVLYLYETKIKGYKW